MAALPDRDPRAERVLVLAPTGRDAEVVVAALADAGIAAERCADIQALCRGIEEGAGGALIAEEALSPDAIAALDATLGAQPPWSDLPIVLVTGRGEHNEARARIVELLEPAGNLAIMERPFRKLTLCTVFESVLRARRRQYEMRDAMDELLRAEQDRLQADALRKGAVFRERLVGVLAHDLRTPLQAIWFTASSLAKADPAEVDVKKSAERIGRAADRMARLISDLLDFTRIRQGTGLPIAPKPSDLEAIARRAVDEVQAAHPGRRIELSCRGDLHGVWDADRIAQVVSNLVGNAVAYSPPDTPVAVGLSATCDEVVLEVKNRGEPIPPAALATIFDPFKRAENGGERASRGLGLGLFIADRIAQAHGGAIRVTSTAEAGTTFTVTLPRRPAEDAEAPAREASTPCPNGHQVLVVEDDESIRDSLRQMLEEEGYRVVTASNGREALEALSHGPHPCVMLLDLMMPVMSGWELLDALAKSGDLARLPVVVVSAVCNANEPPPGVRRCLSKPVHVDSLLAAVGEHCV
jgi:signal transduction histidine kinase/CheY-like chemotaxis protein